MESPTSIERRILESVLFFRLQILVCECHENERKQVVKFQKIEGRKENCINMQVEDRDEHLFTFEMVYRRYFGAIHSLLWTATREL